MLLGDWDGLILFAIFNKCKNKQHIPTHHATWLFRLACVSVRPDSRLLTGACTGRCLEVEKGPKQPAAGQRSATMERHGGVFVEVHRFRVEVQ